MNLIRDMIKNYYLDECCKISKDTITNAMPTIKQVEVKKFKH